MRMIEWSCPTCHSPHRANESEQTIAAGLLLGTTTHDQVRLGTIFLEFIGISTGFLQRIVGNSHDSPGTY